MNQKEIAVALKVGSPLHSKIKEALRARLKMSERRMSDRYLTMAQNEELFQSYIPEREVDALRKRNREVNGVPEYRTIEIPHSYAVLMTAHTYYTSVFCGRNPIFQLVGRHGESEQSRLALEALIGYQAQVGQMMLNLFIWLLDPGKYGYGVIGHHWDTEMVRMRSTKMVQPSFLGIPIPGKAPVATSVVEEQIGYQGNRLFNVRPQDFFPDPRVALVHFQKGEFCSRYVEVPWNEIYEGNASGRYFNYEPLRKARNDRANEQGDVARDEGSERVTTLPGDHQEELGYDVPVGFVKSHEVFLKIIPADWKLGPEKGQEIWAFNITTNGIVFGAQSLGEWHGKFPFDILLDEVDGYSIFPRSTLERCKPLNDVITWLINTHFYNVRQTLNNQFVVDPSMVVMKDVENPDPGKIIRLKPTAYGKDVRMALAQLQTFDVTKNHIGADLGVVIDIVQRMTGTNDSIMGMLESSGRKTATEVRTSTSFGVNRLKTMCEWYSITGFGPLTQKMVQRTQQHYDMKKKFRIVGDLAQFSQMFADVDPAAIAGFYDYEPVDGTLPVDRFAQANLWQMLIGQIAQQPQILAQYDIAKIFAWVANLAGIKNVAQFRLVPDGQLQQQAQAGNVVPIGDAMKQTNLNEPRQTGAGPTG